MIANAFNIEDTNCKLKSRLLSFKYIFFDKNPKIILQHRIIIYNIEKNIWWKKDFLSSFRVTAVFICLQDFSIVFLIFASSMTNGCENLFLETLHGHSTSIAWSNLFRSTTKLFAGVVRVLVHYETFKIHASDILVSFARAVRNL